MVAEATARPVEATEAVVIGGGVVGCAVLLELAMRGIEAVLLEAEPDVGEGASKANSAILHNGFDAKAGTIEARLLRRSADLWPELLDRLGVPWLNCGALMIARTVEEAGRLADYEALAAGHGVETEIVDAAWLRDAAPYINDDATGALHVPGESIVDPFWLTRAYAEGAAALGARIWTGAVVSGLAVDADRVDVATSDGRRLRASQVFDCAGVWADDVARLAGDTSFSLTPRKGQFLVSEHTIGVDRIVLPIPGPLGKGMLVTPIVFGGVLLGPTAEDGTVKSDRSTTAAGRERILESCRGLVPGVDEMDPIRSFAGVRAVSSTGDFIIRPSTAGDRLTIVAGIRSTGVSASPGIAEAAVSLAAEARGWRHDRRAAIPTPAGPELAAEAGPVVCVCRSVGEAEVNAALAGTTPVRTTDALKRRCGVGFGDCQGNRCLVEAIARLAKHAGADPTTIEKHLSGSWLVAGTIDGEPSSAAAHEVPVGVDRPRGWAPVDGASAGVLVVGGGLAGIGAALSLATAGRRVIVVDRGARPGGSLAGVAAPLWTVRERAAVDELAARLARDEIGWWSEATVVGIGETNDGWLVEVVSAAGAGTVTASAVVLATGSYATPREHLAIDGPRPSGVMTADFAGEALDRGWRPGRRVVVSGDGRVARSLSDRLRASGVEVVAEVAWAGDHAARGAAAGVSALRGDRRLEAVRIDARWVEADGLVLAHDARPASFLLRGLGIGDDRPGIPMPVDGDGRLPLDGLWAAGTCVAPSIDHERSLEAGSAVGRSIVAALAAGGENELAAAGNGVPS